MFIAIDGNSTGKTIEKLIFNNDLKELARFSTLINNRVQEISAFIRSQSGSIIMAGGDNILAEIPSSSCEKILHGLGSLTIGDYCFSVSISASVQGAYLGLNYAKASQKKVVEVKFPENGDIKFDELSL